MATFKEFMIPSCPEELADDASAIAHRVVNLTELGELSVHAVDDYANGAVSELCSQDALAVAEQDSFDQIYSMVRSFKSLSVAWRKRLVDGLCSNLSVLSVSSSALGSCEDAHHDEAAPLHRSALKVYIFFLQWLLAQGEKEALEAGKEADAQSHATTSSKGGGRGRKKTANPHEVLSWDWAGQREKVLRSLATVTDLNLTKLFRPRAVEPALLQAWSQSAYSALESATAVKSEGVRESVARIVSACALRYDQLEPTATQLLTLLNAHEHLPAVLGELAEKSARLGDTRLSVELVRELATVDPLEYERQHDAGGVRNVANFLVELADRLPQVVAKNVSLLVPHLGGKAYVMRSAIVSAVGSVIHKGFAEGPAEDADAQGTNARLRSKQHLLNMLLERARDQSAYTRARVLNTWSGLAANGSIPLGHWLCVTQLAIGRLEDKAALVRKAAIQMLMGLLHCNPFGPKLPEDRYLASLEDYKGRLAAIEPPPPSEERDEAAWADGGLQVEGPAIKAEQGQNAVGPSEDGEDVNSGVAVSGEGAEGVAPMEEDLSTGRSPVSNQQRPSTGMDGNVIQLRTLIASLEAGLGFIRAMSGALPLITQLLASSTLSDTQEAISLLIMCYKFDITGADAALRKMLPLVFSPEQGVKDAVVDAVDELYLAGQKPVEAAQNLIQLTRGSNLGELSALEEIVALLLARTPNPLLASLVIKALWYIAERAQSDMGTLAGVEPLTPAKEELRGALIIISMVAVKRPQTVIEHLPLLLKVGLSGGQHDAMSARYACVALRHISVVARQTPDNPEAPLSAVYDALVRTILRPATLDDAGWYSVAEAAISALFALHPSPQNVCSDIARVLAGLALKTRGEEGDTTGGTSALSRAFFMLGHTALQQLVHVEALAKAIRRQRADAEKAQAEARSDRLAAGATQVSQPDEEEEDIGAQLGVGSVAADAELDTLKEAAEAEILASKSLLGGLSQVVATFCHNRAMIAAHPRLRASALLALTKLMVIDPLYCDRNLQLVFTLLQTRSVEAPIRSNLVIAVGDLAFRFPTLLGPWTAHIYHPLTDPDTGVRKNALMVLSHLILNDMMKVKGHIARLALCLQDSDRRISALAELFFHELARKAYKGSNPIYNLLPDILSQLSAEPGLPPADFQAIMRHLLQYIGREKHADSIVEKLCARFEAADTPAQWRNLVFCLGQLTYTEKGLRKMMESVKSYRAALNDAEVLAAFQAIFTKGKKVAKQSADFKSDVEAFEEVLAAHAATCESGAPASGSPAETGESDISVEGGETRPCESGISAEGESAPDGLSGVEGGRVGLVKDEGGRAMSVESGEGAESGGQSPGGSASTVERPAPLVQVKAEPMDTASGPASPERHVPAISEGLTDVPNSRSAATRASKRRSATAGNPTTREASTGETAATSERRDPVIKVEEGLGNLSLHGE